MGDLRTLFDTSVLAGPREGRPRLEGDCAASRRVAVAYGELRMAAPERVPANDLWIAATATAYDLELITADRRQAALPHVRAQLV